MSLFSTACKNSPDALRGSLGRLRRCVRGNRGVEVSPGRGRENRTLIPAPELSTKGHAPPLPVLLGFGFLRSAEEVGAESFCAPLTALCH